MSVLNPISILPYAGLNATGPYAITFDVFLDDGGNAKDITVLLLAGGAITDITSTSTFTGKNVYTSASYNPSDTVVLLRDPLFTQPYVYSGVTQFPGRTIEKTYDRLLFLIQRLRLDVERSLKFPLTDLPARDMPAKALMASQGLFFDTAGEPISTGGLTNFPVTYCALTILDDMTIADMLVTLGIDNYYAAIVAAQDTADGKIVTFFQADPPTAEGTGDLWIKTNAGNKLYRWSGAEWSEVQDDDIAQAIADAGTAQATADNKIVTFYQESVPTATDVGDLWVDTNDKNKLYRAACVGANEIKAGEWEAARDADIAEALSDAAQAILDAAAAQSTADGKIVTFYQAGIPISTDIGDIWIDTDDGNKLYRAEMVGANEIKAGEWVEIQDDGIAQAIDDAATAQGTADGKIVTFFQASEPTGVAVGDIWVDTDDDNHPYRWSGSAWLSIRDQVVITANRLAVGALEAQFANISHTLTIGFSGTGTPGSPNTGDGRIRMEGDALIMQVWSGSAWVDKVRIVSATGGANTILSGDLEISENIYLLTSNGKLLCGANQDLKVFHDGTNSWIKHVGTGNLLVGYDSNLIIEILITGIKVYGTLNVTGKTTLPVGTMYTQFNGKSAPGDLFIGTWTDRSSLWAGRFFRAVGGAAAAFGTAQADAFQGHWHNLTNGTNVLRNVEGDPSKGYYVDLNESHTLIVGNPRADGFSGNPRIASETRPINYAIKIWERTA